MTIHLTTTEVVVIIVVHPWIIVEVLRVLLDLTLLLPIFLVASTDPAVVTVVVAAINTQ